MATLTGSKPKDTYQSLLKLSSGQASTTIKNVEDGVGNATALSVGTTAVEVTSLLITNTPTISSTETTVLVYDDTDNTVKVRELGSSSFEQVNSFTTIAVTGQSSLVADSPSDQLGIIPGAGVVITTNASTDTMTIAQESLGQAMYARTSASQVVTSSATPLTYYAVNNSNDDASYSFGSGFTLGTSNTRILVSQDGAVRVGVNLQATCESAGSVLTVALKINGATIRTHKTGALAVGASEVISFTHVLGAAASNYIEVVVSAVGDGISISQKSLVEVQKVSSQTLTFAS